MHGWDAARGFPQDARRITHFLSHSTPWFREHSVPLDSENTVLYCCMERLFVLISSKMAALFLFVCTNNTYGRFDVPSLPRPADAPGVPGCAVGRARR